MRIRVLGLLGLLLIGCPKHTPLREAERGTGTQLLFAIADPQIHNIYGSSLLLGSGTADLGVQVARRRAELNILAPFVFRHFLDKGLERDPGLTLLLGDLTNIACTGEYDTVREQVRQASEGKSGLVLFAHGNHDTYLMGITNHYFPFAETEDTYPALQRTLKAPHATAPVDESWWPDVEVVAKRSWPSACATADGKGKPLNKGQWMARYLEHLTQYGVKVESVEDHGHFALRTSVPGRDNLHVAGEWYPPNFEVKKGLLRPYSSFLVQALDYGDYRVIVIDTSACPEPSTTIWGSAGSRGCIGDPQFRIIEKYIGEANGRPIVIAGHFNLKELTTCGERSELIELLAKNNATYLSAHTHDGATLRSNFGVREINVSSTTDWPMGAQLLLLEDKQVKPGEELTLTAGVPSYAGNTRFDEAFSDLRHGQPFEACRHLAAARALAELKAPFPVVWDAPTTDSDCRAADPRELQVSLKGYVDEIERRVRSPDEPSYRDYVLNLAAGASFNDQCKCPAFFCPVR